MTKTANDAFDQIAQQFALKQVTFEAVIRAMQKRIKGIARQAARKYYRYKPLYDIDDYEAATLYALHKALQTWKREKAGFVTYFERVARYEINQIRKSMNSQSRRSNLAVAKEDAEFTGEEANSLAHADHGYRSVEFALSYDRLALTDKQDKLCRLIMQGYKQKEIARRLHVSEAAVSMALKRLRGKFEQVRQ